MPTVTLRVEWMGTGEVAIPQLACDSASSVNTLLQFLEAHLATDCLELFDLSTLKRVPIMTVRRVVDCTFTNTLVEDLNLEDGNAAVAITRMTQTAWRAAPGKEEEAVVKEEEVVGEEEVGEEEEAVVKGN
jgi:molybdopterin-binding protein